MQFQEKQRIFRLQETKKTKYTVSGDCHRPQMPPTRSTEWGLGDEASFCTKVPSFAYSFVVFLWIP